MGEKSTYKKKLIVEKAREVFAAKGFADVTMKDVVEAAGISRGGLYLYFSSTEELFLEVLKAESAEDEAEVERAMEGSLSAGDMLTVFLKEQKKEILRKKNNLLAATYEYYFAHRTLGAENPLKQDFEKAVMVLTKVIENGIAAGEFICDEPLSYARNIMYVIEGMKVSSRTMGITEGAVDRELVYLVGGLVPEEA